MTERGVLWGAPFGFARGIAAAWTLVLPGLAQAQQVGRALGAPPGRDTLHGRSGVIDGAVTDTNLVPLAGVEVGILRTSVRLHTGTNGRFRFVGMTPGAYLIIVRRLGYRPLSGVVQVAPSDTLRLSYSLERVPAELDAVVITERRQSLRMLEFESRRKLGEGQFMTQSDIERRESLEVTDLLRTFRGLDASPSRTRGSMGAHFAVSKRGGAGFGNVSGSCAMQVFVDGVQMPYPFNLDLLPSPKELAGIEVYSGAATIPVQFSGYDRGCGMILIWTRDR